MPNGCYPKTQQDSFLVRNLLMCQNASCFSLHAGAKPQDRTAARQHYNIIGCCSRNKQAANCPSDIINIKIQQQACCASQRKEHCRKCSKIKSVEKAWQQRLDDCYQNESSGICMGHLKASSLVCTSVTQLLLSGTSKKEVCTNTKQEN